MDDSISIKQFGNVLEVTIRIPWADVHGRNAWEDYFKQQQEKARQQAEQGRRHWEYIESQVMKAYDLHGSISEAAKYANCKYYTARLIIQETLKKRRAKIRQQTQSEARQLHASGMHIRDIAYSLGKCPETIRKYITT